MEHNVVCVSSFYNARTLTMRLKQLPIRLIIRQGKTRPDRLLIKSLKRSKKIQAWIARVVAHRRGTREVQGSNPGKGEKFSMEISN